MTRNFALSLAVGLMAIGIVPLVGPTSARADIYVIESTAAGVRVGSRLADTDSMAIPDGAYVRAVLPSGKTQTVRGPYNGKVSELAKGAAQNEGVMAWLTSMLKSGGSSEVTTGATRSVTRAPGKPRAFSWTEVPSTVDGDICVQKGGKLLLTRGAVNRMDRATLVDVTSGERGEVVWEAGSQTADWPANVKLRPDGAYQVFIQDRPRRQVVVRVVDAPPADADVLTELHKLGCKYQFEAWVRDRLVASKG